MSNKFKGLDLIDRVPGEVWMEVCAIVQEMVINTIPKTKKGKWLSEEALQIAGNRREVKGKQEKERYATLMQSFKELQGKIRKPSEVNNANK